MQENLDVIAFGAHPDDVELSCGGTLAKLKSKGYSIGIIDLTRGELGTRGTAEIRDNEAAEAAKILGVDLRHNLKFRDGFFENNEAHQLEVVKIIRKYRPNIVLLNAIEDRHPDHKKASDLVSQSCFLSGLAKVDTGQDAWRPKQVYHYIQFKEITPDFVVDISDFIDVKIQAVKAFSSQFFNPNSNEADTVISTQGFLESIRYRAANLGRISMIEYAEGFTVEKPIVVDITDLK